MAHAPNKADKFHQGKYKIKNVEKYLGNPVEIVYRSSWEYKFMLYCDLNSGVLKWGSEIITIPYVDINGKSHRYIPDFYLETRSKANPDFLNRYLVEIKPEKETLEPQIPLNITEKKLKQLEYQISTWQVNKYKWVYAKEWCKARDIKFWIVTEKNLDLFKI